ncbi:MAG TPA: hypothetical protein VL984_07945 [Acidimicrobiales bacterium]|nr:hypothetical protein [Acidimicrobiales bacterium]
MAGALVVLAALALTGLVLAGAFVAFTVLVVFLVAVAAAEVLLDAEAFLAPPTFLAADRAPPALDAAREDAFFVAAFAAEAALGGRPTERFTAALAGAALRPPLPTALVAEAFEALVVLTALVALVALFAFVAFVALVALVAFVALVALVALAAAPARALTVRPVALAGALEAATLLAGAFLELSSSLKPAAGLKRMPLEAAIFTG